MIVYKLQGVMQNILLSMAFSKKQAGIFALLMSSYTIISFNLSVNNCKAQE